MGEARRRLQAIGLKPKCILDAEEEARREAERKLDGTRFVWFCMGIAVTVIFVIIALLT